MAQNAAGRDQPDFYQICLRGHLDRDQWSEWFEGLTFTHNSDGTTTLSGPADQADLHGWLKKVRDLGITLISVNPIQQSDT